jgi:AcrR family transcriptional regulator
MSAHARRTQAERSAATRAALLDAARRLFAEQGYGAPADEIVALAGVSRGALQHHFGDKQGLFTAVYEVTEQEVVAGTATAAMAAGDDALEQLRAGCHAYLDAVLDPAVQRICAVDGPAVLPVEVRDQITDRYAVGLVREAITHAMESGRMQRAPVEALTRVLLAGVMAAAMFVALADDHDAARTEAGRTVDVLLDSLATPAP